MHRKTKICIAAVLLFYVFAIIANRVVSWTLKQPELSIGLPLVYQPYFEPIDLDAITGPPESMAKWNEWKNLPESEKVKWFDFPGFKYMEDYYRLVDVFDEEIHSGDFENWVVRGNVDLKNRGWISERERRRLLKDTVMFDCQAYLLDDRLKEAIQGAPKLTWLRLSDEFTDQDFGWLADLSNLKGLSLEAASIQNLDLSVLEGLQKLKWLDLKADAERTLILPPLPDLEVLEMTGFGVTDQHLSVSGQYPKLIALDVISTAVTDKGVALVSMNCPRLKMLNIGCNNEITYNCVASLGKLKELRYLYVNHTPLEIQANGFKYHTIPELQIMLPNCHIRIGER